MSAQRIAVHGGRLIDPANKIDQPLSLYLSDGVVVAIGDAPDGFQSDRQIQLNGQIVAPGLIDLCARLREPGQTFKATIASETAAAARGGFTTLCTPPDTAPVIDMPAVAELVKERAEQAGQARLLPVAALTKRLEGESLSPMYALKEAGCIAVSNANQPLANLSVLRHAMEYAVGCDLLLMIRPDDPWLRGDGYAHEGEVSTRLGMAGIPPTAETVAVAQALLLIEQIGGRVHFSQLSTTRAVNLIAQAQRSGLPVTADVSAHQLHLTETALAGFDPLYHLDPPLRSEEDRAGLCQGVIDNVISAVCSDHQPHEEGAKQDAFSSTEPGISSLETVLPLLLRLVDARQLTISQAVARLTTGPAALLRIDRGTLGVGAVADVTIFDPQQQWVVDHNHWRSQGLNTPFWGTTMHGKVTHTVLAGEVVYCAGRLDVRPDIL